MIMPDCVYMLTILPLQLYRDGKRVLECLQRALRVADSCMETTTSIELFVEILDRYVYYFDQQNESVRALRVPLFHAYFVATSPIASHTGAKRLLTGRDVSYSR